MVEYCVVPFASGLVNSTGDGCSFASLRGSGIVPGQSGRYDWPSKSSSSLKQPLIFTSVESAAGDAEVVVVVLVERALVLVAGLGAVERFGVELAAVLEVADLVRHRHVVGVRRPRVAARVGGRVLGVERVRRHLAGGRVGLVQDVAEAVGDRRGHRAALAGRQVGQVDPEARPACRACGSGRGRPGSSAGPSARSGLTAAKFGLSNVPVKSGFAGACEWPLLRDVGPVDRLGPAEDVVVAVGVVRDVRCSGRACRLSIVIAAQYCVACSRSPRTAARSPGRRTAAP